MQESLSSAFWRNFLGQSPLWYKQTIIAFLLVNPVLLAIAGPFVTGWVLIGEFIFTLALALRCYPLQPGGLLAIEAVLLGMTSPDTVFHETEANFEVILLLMFMVAGIYFMKEMLLWVFTRILLTVQSKRLLSLLFCAVAAVLSAFLDALTVTAVLIAVSVGFYSVYHRVASGKSFDHDHDHSIDEMVHENHREDLEQFRAFLRSLMMHGAVGTALGGVCTLVGEPQNLLIATVAEWDFVKFVTIMAPVTMPVLFFGLATCWLLEATGRFGYGATLPPAVRMVLMEFQQGEEKHRNARTDARLLVQAFVALLLVVALAMHWAAVGLIGLMVIVLLTAFNGVVEEHQIGHAFEEALPFTALLVVFFAIVAVIHDQHLFTPVIDAVLAMEAEIRPSMFFLANGLLSMISDNVFVATVYINEVRAALDAGARVILMSHLGRPTEGEYDEAFSMAPVAAHLAGLLGRPVAVVKDWRDGIELADGEVAMLENVRFNPGEKSNDDALAKAYASLCDVFVMDAFGTAHRAQASTHGVAKFAPVACAGPLLQGELEALEQALSAPARPMLAIVGGSKVSTKLTVLETLADKVDQLVVGGGIANTFLAAAGHPVGRSLCEHDLIPAARALMDKTSVPLPTDVVTGKELSESAAAEIKAVAEVAEDDMILDVGPQSAAAIADSLRGAGTILWNGPVGVFEFDQFAAGTEALARAIAESGAFSLAGGGDTLAAIDKYGIADRVSYISTGGGAFLEYVEGKKLPALAVLEERARGG